MVWTGCLRTTLYGYVEGNEFNCPEVILSVKRDENLTVTDV